MASTVPYVRVSTSWTAAVLPTCCHMAARNEMMNEAYAVLTVACSSVELGNGFISLEAPSDPSSSCHPGKRNRRI